MSANEKDFASAAMMRLVIAGLSRQGIEVSVASPDGAHVEIVEKRHLLQEVMNTHGPLSILAISDAVPTLPPEPVVLALRQAQSIEDLFARWSRLEEFSHKRHRVEIEVSGSDTYTMQHIAKDRKTVPTKAESLLVLGLLAKLCDELSTRPVTLADRDGNIWRQDGKWIDNATLESVNPMILKAYSSATVAASSTALEMRDENTLRQVIVNDPVRNWTVKSLAQHAGTSERTLQRRLAERSSSFSRIVSEARLQVAAQHLCDERQAGLSEIGFLCGYTDQAHFTRSFKKGVGTTPQKYRSSFT